MYQQSYISMCFLFICIVDCNNTIKILLVANGHILIMQLMYLFADKCRLIGPYIPKILVAEKSYNQMKLLWTMVNTVTCSVYIHILCNTVYLKAKDNHTILFLDVFLFINISICSVNRSLHPCDKTEDFLKKKVCTQKKTIFGTYK